MPDKDKPTAQPNSDAGPQQDVDLSAPCKKSKDDAEIETRVDE